MSDLADIRLNIILAIQGAAAIAALNTGIGNLATRQGTLAKATGGVNSSMNAQKATMTGIIAKLTAAEQKYDAVFRASYRLQIVGYTLIGVGQKILSMVTSLTSAWGDFEFMVNRAAGALQVWKTAGGQATPIYNALIESIYQTTKELRLFPAADVAKSVYFWASTTGQAVTSQKDLLAVMSEVNPIMKVAALTQTDYETAIKGVYSILVQYGRGLSNTADVTAKLFLVAQRTALEFPDLINSFKMVGPVAGSLGVSFEEVAQVLGAIGDAGIRGTMAGRALRQVFIRLVKPPAAAAAAMDAVFRSTQAIGKGFNDVVFPNGKFVGLTNYVHLLAVALKDATVEQRDHILALSSTANELPVLIALVNNEIKTIKGVPGAYDSAKASVLNAAEAADQFNKAWGLLADSWKGVTGRISAGIEIIRLRLGRVIAEALKPATENLTKLLDKIELWVKRNPALVETMTKWAGFVGVFAAGFGGVLVFTGALLGLAAALGVLLEGFGKVIAQVVGFSSILIALGESIVRNWVRVVNSIGPAVNRLAQALGLSSTSFKDIMNAVKEFHDRLNAVMDFIVSRAIRVITALIDALTALAKSPVGAFLGLLAKSFEVAFGATLIYGMVRGLSLLSGGILMVGVNAVKTAAAMLLMDARMVLAAVGTGDLRLALNLLSKTTVLVVLTALIALFTVLHDLIPPLGKFMDGLFHGITQDTQDLKDNLADIISQIPVLTQDRIRNQIALTAEATGHWADKIAAVKTQMDNLQGLHGASVLGSNALTAQRAALQKQLDQLQHDQADSMDKMAKGLQSAADTAGVSLDEWVTALLKWENTFHLSFSQANTDIQAWYATLNGGQPTVEAAIQYWNANGADLFKAGVKPIDFLESAVGDPGIKQFVNDLYAKTRIALASQDLALGKYSLGYQILQGLTANSSNFSDQINGQVKDLVARVPDSVKSVVDQTVQIATEAPGKIFDAFVSALKGLGDVHKRFQAAVKSSIKPADFAKTILGQITAADVKKAFSDPHLGLAQWGQSVLDDAETALSAAIAAGTPKQIIGIATQFKKMFTPQQLLQAELGTLTTFKGMKLTKEQQASLQGIADFVYTQLGLTTPTPATTTAISTQINQKLPKWLATELGASFNRPTTVSPGADIIATATAGMKTQWETAGGGKDFLDQVSRHVTATLSPNEYVGGWNVMKSWVGGMKGYLGSLGSSELDHLVKSVANKLVGSSPPPEGPLKTVDKGGYNVMKAWAGGVTKGGTLAILSAQKTAADINDALKVNIPGMDSNGSMSITHDTTRTLRVSLDVTSKDGSISGVTMKQLSNALIDGGFIKELEHMSAVG